MRIHKEIVVAFIDLLGTKARNIADAEKIYVLFQNFLQRNEERQKNFHRSYSRKCWFFSDCAYMVYFQNESSEEVSNFEVLRPMLENLSIELLKFWDEGFLVRGGIAIGEGCFHTDKQIFCGDAFNKASSFDTTGLPPCIFLSPELAKGFGQALHEAEEIRRLTIDPMFIDRTSFPEYILRDDDRYFLNALYYLEDIDISAGVDDRMIHPAQYLQKMSSYFEEQIWSARAYDRKSVAEKWEWMRNYFYARLCPFDFDINPELCYLWQESDNESKSELLKMFESHIKKGAPDLSGKNENSDENEKKS